MNMWHRKEGDYWHMREEFHYPGVTIFVHKRNDLHAVVLRNLAAVPLTAIEVARDPKEAFTDYQWRTIEAAKSNAELVRFDRDWLHTAGITFNEKIMSATRRDALYMIHVYLTS